MLATREDWRGKGLALVLGAQAIVRLVDRFGAVSFNTGVKADNGASLALRPLDETVSTTTTEAMGLTALGTRPLLSTKSSVCACSSLLASPLLPSFPVDEAAAIVPCATPVVDATNLLVPSLSRFCHQT